MSRRLLLYCLFSGLQLFQRLMIAIDLSKQPAPDADPKATQQINFTANLNRGEGVNDNTTTTFFIIIEAKRTILDFSQETVKVLLLYFILLLYQYKITQSNTLNVKLPY